jgi:hypothetical protein
MPPLRRDHDKKWLVLPVHGMRFHERLQLDSRSRRRPRLRTQRDNPQTPSAGSSPPISFA